MLTFDPIDTQIIFLNSNVFAKFKLMHLNSKQIMINYAPFFTIGIFLL